jgi:two-component system, chemotaxis family, protein-glutamate methylesterase/glutaminase
MAEAGVGSTEEPQRRDIIVVGGSAGAVDAVSRFAGMLPGTLPAAVFVVIHVSALYRSRLPEIISRHGPLPAQHAADGEIYSTGRIYVAPPDRHLVLEGGRTRLLDGPRENGVRPAIDPLFRSAAQVGPRAIGVILSGTLDDGALGLLALKSRGGLAMVQAPDDAAYPEMIRNAMEIAKPEFVGSLEELAGYIAEAVLAGDGILTQAEGGRDAPELRDGDKEPVALTCPDCGGPIYAAPGSLKFACKVGHQYGPESFYDKQRDQVERAMWSALRSLKEQEDFARQLAERSEKRALPTVARRFRQRQEDAAAHARQLEELLTRKPGFAEGRTG